MESSNSAWNRIGPLEYHADLDQFCGDVAVDDCTVSVTLDMNGRQASDALLECGLTFLRHLSTLQRAAMDHVCIHMLKLKNQTWLRELESPVSEAEFKDRLKLIQAWLNPDGTGALTFEDGGLFWGHDVIVDFASDGSFGRPSLYG